MSLFIDKDGTMYLYQGDSGKVVLSGLNTEKKYTVYLAFQDKNRKIIGKELQVACSSDGWATFVLTPGFTDLLKVPKNKLFEIYYYGLKLCEDGADVENTLFVADSVYGDINRVVVYPRKVIGVENGTV